MTLPLPPILLTDVKYRASLAAVQALGKAGYPVYTAQTEAELQGTPPAFSSVYALSLIHIYPNKRLFADSKD